MLPAFFFSFFRLGGCGCVFGGGGDAEEGSQVSQEGVVASLFGLEDGVEFLARLEPSAEGGDGFGGRPVGLLRRGGVAAVGKFEAAVVREAHVRLVLRPDGDDVLHDVELKDVKVFVDGGVEQRLELVGAVFDFELGGLFGGLGLGLV